MACRSSSRSWRAGRLSRTYLRAASAPDHEGPRVGAHCAEMWVSTLVAAAPPSAARSSRSRPLASQSDSRGPVPGVDEVRRAAARLLARLEDRVVAQVGGDVDVGAAGPHVVEQVVPAPPSTATRAPRRPVGPATRTPPGRRRQRGVPGARRSPPARPAPASRPTRPSGRPSTWRAGSLVGEAAGLRRGRRRRRASATSALVCATYSATSPTHEAGDAGALGASWWRRCAPRAAAAGGG